MNTDIVFHQPTVQVTINNKELYTHHFKAVNIGNTLINKLSVTKGCSCTEVICPAEIKPNEEFEVIAIIDKRKDKGIFSVGAIIEFDNGQKIKLNVSGKIEQND